MLVLHRHKYKKEFLILKCSHLPDSLPLFFTLSQFVIACQNTWVRLWRDTSSLFLSNMLRSFNHLFLSHYDTHFFLNLYDSIRFIIRTCQNLYQNQFDKKEMWQIYLFLVDFYKSQLNWMFDRHECFEYVISRKRINFRS